MFGSNDVTLIAVTPIFCSLATVRSSHGLRRVECQAIDGAPSSLLTQAFTTTHSPSYALLPLHLTGFGMLFFFSFSSKYLKFLLWVIAS